MAKNYWLKLREHFFEEDEMIFLQSQENGYKYLYLWQRLLLKCLKADDKESCGFLRFNDKIPYRPDILAASFRMDVDTVRAGIAILQSMGLLDIMDDGTYYIEHVQRYFGRDDDSAERVRRHREKKKLLEAPHDKDIEIEKEEEKEGHRYSNVTCNGYKREEFTPPAIEEIIAYMTERNSTGFTAEQFHDFYTMKGWMVGKNKMKDWRAAVRTWEKRSKEEHKDDFSWCD